MDRSRSRGEALILLSIILLAILVRLWLMATQPLTDLTEARYGELARVTADGNYWLMPHLAPGEPFFAKPPLSTWLAALSWKLLGQNEFCLRLPSLVLSLAAAAMLLGVAAEFGIGPVGKWMLAAMLATSPIWVVSAGSVMTDATQMTVVTAAMVTSWMAIQHPGARRWRILFWGTLGLATLSKGAATVALIGMPLTACVCFGEGWTTLKTALWDRIGVLLAIGIALAWYVPAELAYPGFLKYFLVGEHLQRFLEPNWNGDRFGHAHSVPMGTIWLFWAGATCFWFPVMLQELGAFVRKPAALSIRRPDRWLWCWILAPLIFFTFARNVMWTYTLTAIPPFALMVGRWAETSTHLGRRLTPSLLAGCSLAVLGLCVFWAPEKFESRSARSLVAEARALRPGQPLYFSGCFRHSSSFYTNGEARRVQGPAELESLMNRPGIVLITTALRADHEVELGRARILAAHPGAALLESAPSRFAAK